MDRNQFIGLALILGLIFLWTMYMEPPNDAKITNTDAQKKTYQPPTSPPSLVVETAQDSLARRQNQLKERYGPFFAYADPRVNRERTIEVVTDKLKIAFSNKGARPTVVYLNEYRTYDSLPLPLIVPRPENLFDLTFNAQGRVVSTADLYFVPSAGALEVRGKEQKTLTFSVPTDSGTLELRYVFVGDRYDVGLEVGLKNFDRLITDDSYLFRFANLTPKTEKSAASMNPEVKLCYRYLDDDAVESMDGTESDSLVERTPASLKWLAFKSQFFSLALIAEEKFNAGALLKQKP
ncbi:MAG: YidC/Oxa1 family insertase periplasmic-domain containing protein, partial [Bacteroidia bacterium]|nr:YidC/Oxa1 family insertase periplasmic-domain containing protein [Bacteroidia bacterium]